MVSSLVSLTLASIDNTEIVRRYIALAVGCVLGMLAQWVVMAQAQEEEHQGHIERGFARIVSGGLASLVAGFFVLDRLGETPIIDAQFRLWLAMLIAGFGGMGVLELTYHRFVKKLTGEENNDA